MIRSRRLFMLTIALLVSVALTVAACSVAPMLIPAGGWTPSPVSEESTALETPQEALVVRKSPTVAASPTPVPTPTAPKPTATLVPSPSPLPPTEEPELMAQAAAAPTVDPHLFYITEDAIADAVASGSTEGSGLTVSGLVVRFTDGKIHIAADSVQYGSIRINNLDLVGKLVAQDGRLRLETESISPGGLLGALVPAAANQALTNYASQWYVEEVQILDGMLEFRIQ